MSKLAILEAKTREIQNSLRVEFPVPKCCLLNPRVFNNFRCILPNTNQSDPGKHQIHQLVLDRLLHLRKAENPDMQCPTLRLQSTMSKKNSKISSNMTLKCVTVI